MPTVGYEATPKTPVHLIMPYSPECVEVEFCEHFAIMGFSEVGTWESAEAYGVSFGVSRPTIMSRRDQLRFYCRTMLSQERSDTLLDTRHTRAVGAAVEVAVCLDAVPNHLDAAVLAGGGARAWVSHTRSCRRCAFPRQAC